jgi:hypothetical protein
MLNVSDRLLVNVYCFSLFFGENVGPGQVKEMLMDLTTSSRDTRRGRVAYHVVIAAMLGSGLFHLSLAF